jgi:hypothetical protein
MSSLAAFLTVLILRVARIVGITILVSVFVACLLGQGPTAPIKAATTVSSVPAAAGSEIPPVKAASEQLIPVVMPLAVFLDISNSGNSKTFEIAERNRIAELLSACPEGTPISVITFNRNAALLFSGRISTPAVVTLMESLDQAKRGGPTDLWRAVEAAHSQSWLPKTFDVAVVSDFYLTPPAGSPGGGKDLSKILESLHGAGARRVLLLPIGVVKPVNADGFPQYVETIPKGSLAKWTASLTIPTAAKPPVPRRDPRFWERPSYQIAAALAFLVAVGAFVFFIRERIEQRAAKEQKLLTAAPLDPAKEEGKLKAKLIAPVPPPVATIVWHVQVLETGREVPVLGKITAGNEPLADLYSEDAVTTLEVKVIQQDDAVRILNAGAKDAFIGQRRLPPGAWVDLRCGLTAQCILAASFTLRFHATKETVEEEA